MDDKKVDLNKIQELPKPEFEDIMKNWVNEKDLVSQLHAKMRFEIIRNFYNTKVGKKLELQELQQARFTFDPIMLAISTLLAEFLYNQKFYFSLSVFIMENQFKELPDFEKNSFRFNKEEILDLLELLGIQKREKNNQRLLKNYLNSDKKESLIYLLLKQLVKERKSSEVTSMGIQTETDYIPISQVSPNSQKVKSKKRKRKNHSLHKSECRKSLRSEKSSNNISIIAENLTGMSKTINEISVKLDNFKHSKEPELQNDKIEIVNLVGSTCQNLNECVTNFEKLCDNIQQTQTKEEIETEKTFDEWMNELENSEHGKKFCRKLRKSYTSIIKEERSKIKREYRKKFSNEKYKMRKDKQKQGKSFTLIDDKLKELDVKEKSLEHKLNLLDKKLLAEKPKNKLEEEQTNVVQEESNVVNEITDFLKSTCLALKTLEKENELYEKSLQINIERNNLDKKSLQKEKENIYKEYKIKNPGKFEILKKMERPKAKHQPKPKLKSSSSSSTTTSSSSNRKSSSTTSQSSSKEILV